MMGEYSNCPCNNINNGNNNNRTINNANTETFISYPSIHQIRKNPLTKYDYEKKQMDLGYNDYRDSSFRTDNKNIYQSGPYLNF